MSECSTNLDRHQAHASQKFNRMIVEGLVKNGCQVDALTQRIPLFVDNEEMFRTDETENTVSFHYLPCKKNKLVNRLMTIVEAKKQITKWHRLHKKGIIICDIILGELSLAVLFASITHRLRTVAIVTDVPSIRAGENRKGIKAIPFRIKNAIIQNYKGYVFLTEQMSQSLNKRGKPYVVIEGIVDKHVIDNPNTLQQKYKKKVCMMAGLLESVFGVDELIEAFMQVNNPDARLCLYGKGSSVAKIQEKEKEDSRIQYLGELTNSQIVDEEKKATLLINPRPPVGKWTSFSFPSKNMEYIASGTPMLAYWLPCIPDEYLPYSYYIMNTDNRILALTQLLTTILSKEREEIHNMGIKAQEWIVSNKNAEIQTHKIINMIHNIR